MLHQQKINAAIEALKVEWHHQHLLGTLPAVPPAEILLALVTAILKALDPS